MRMIWRSESRPMGIESGWEGHAMTRRLVGWGLGLSLAAILTSACGTLTGAAVGAGSGAAIGAATGNTKKGALIGTGVGAAAGTLYDWSRH